MIKQLKLKKPVGLLIILLVFSGLQTKAQENIVSKGLQIGDKVPESLIKNIENYKSKSAYLSSFRGKLLILDFWATWCSPCRAMMPVLDSLQNIFRRDLVILPVAYESHAKVAPVLAQIKKRRPFNLPGVTGDKLLNKMFPHTYLPHYVWIDKKGIVRAITGEEGLTAQNIKNMIESKPNHIAVKQDLQREYDVNRPLFMNGNGGGDSVVSYRSVFSKFIPGLKGGMDILPFDSLKGQRIVIRNVPLRWLITLAYYDKGVFLKNRMRILTADSGKIVRNLPPNGYGPWISQNGICYEVSVPPLLKDSVFAFVRDDLRRLYPNYQIGLEHVQTRCRVLIRTGDQDKLRTAGGPSAVDMSPFDFVIKNVSIKYLTARLSDYFMQNSPYPIIDGTGYKDPVDISLHASMSNVDEVNRELSKYDLKFVDQDAWTDIIFVRDSK